MLRPNLQLRALLLTLAAATTHAQTTPRKPHPKPQLPYNPNVILLDPAHGGTDIGAKLADNSLEKDATLAFAARIKTLLTTHGFTVILTHDSASDLLTPDQRAELANHSRAVACLLLHASNGGHGVHLFTSSLPPSPEASAEPDTPKVVLPWSTAQSASIPQSLLLSADLSDALSAIRVPLVSIPTSVQPIDSLTCPAVAIELSPLAAAPNPDSPADTPAPTPPSDPAYQQRIAVAVVTALDAWRGKIIAGTAISNETPTPPTKTPTPKPKAIPIETPEIVSPTKPPGGPPK